ncbi:unnamed protein product, partial [Tilletia controversa]
PTWRQISTSSNLRDTSRTNALSVVVTLDEVGGFKRLGRCVQDVQAVDRESLFLALISPQADGQSVQIMFSNEHTANVANSQ